MITTNVKADVPTVTTIDATNVKETSVKINGFLNNDSDKKCSNYFDYGVTNYNYLEIIALTSGSGQWTIPNHVTSIDVLVVAGGGGGGSMKVGSGLASGGGGAGGLIWIQEVTKLGNVNISVGNNIYYSIGEGGDGGQDGGATINTRGKNGGDSIFGNLTAKGGGGGGGSQTPAYCKGVDGGSGGGGSYYAVIYPGGAETQSSQADWSGEFGYGHNGSSSSYGLGGGGGGSFAEGSIPTGGAGKDLSSYFGTSYGIDGVFAKGGDGSVEGSGQGDSAPDNTGNGGEASDNAYHGGHGGSGIILIGFTPNPNILPNADANGPYYADVNENINLDGSGSTDSDGTIVSYAWDLDNDGAYDDATGVTPSWSWSTGGSHLVSLNVTDNDGATDTDGSTVYVNEFPVADANGPYYGNKGETIILDGSSSSDSDGTIVSYDWDLDNDGVYDDASGIAPSWSWSESGTYTIGLKVIDDDAATDTDTTDVYIELDEYPPTASFTYTPEQPKVGDEVSFDASGSTDHDGNIVSYSWDFGDDTTGSGMITSHMYSEPARYTVVLTVVDNDNLVDTVSVTIEVGTEGEFPVAYFTWSPDNPCVNESIMFNASSSFSPGGIIESYAWHFGDDTNGTGIIATHNYTISGNYSVNLTVTDNHGLNDSITKIIRINLTQIPNIEIDEINGLFGITVYINNTGISEASNVHWSITVEVGFGIILSGERTEGTIDVLAVGESKTIQSNGLRGIGLITITVQADDASKQATAFLLGPLVLRVTEL